MMGRAKGAPRWRALSVPDALFSRQANLFATCHRKIARMTTQYKILNGRVATEDEAEAKTVIFFVPDGRSQPYTFASLLPLAARTRLEGEQNGFPAAGTEIQIIQAELVDDKDVVLGFLYDGEAGICVLSDVELTGEPPSS